MLYEVNIFLSGGAGINFPYMDVENLKKLREAKLLRVQNVSLYFRRSPNGARTELVVDGKDIIVYSVEEIR